MFDYELVDFGMGRKLERFGPYLLDRPCPAADGVGLAPPGRWREASARFERTVSEQGNWTSLQPMPEHWPIRCGGLKLELKRTPFGHVGIFPEQTANWAWLERQVLRLRGDAQPIRVLNLFAYTGAATLTAAAAGAEVVHVDAAKNVVTWARRNAELSQLADRPIRWIVEDARKFVAREARRGNRYDAIVLDPPSYGHGPGGQSWRMEDHLDELLRGCLDLASPEPRFFLCTAHTPNFDAAALRTRLAAAGFNTTRAEPWESLLTTSDGRNLRGGFSVRLDYAAASPRSTTSAGR